MIAQAMAQGKRVVDEASGNRLFGLGGQPYQRGSSNGAEKSPSSWHGLSLTWDEGGRVKTIRAAG